jgi:hypothetical protein
MDASKYAAPYSGLPWMVQYATEINWIWYIFGHVLLILIVLLLIDYQFNGSLGKLLFSAIGSDGKLVTSTALSPLFKIGSQEFVSHRPSRPWEHAHVWRVRPEHLWIMAEQKKNGEHYTPFYSTVSVNDADAGSGIYGPFASM